LEHTLKKNRQNILILSEMRNVFSQNVSKELTWTGYRQ